MQVNRTSELARVFGIDFFSVLSRGSQYRVESMLLRLAHTQNYLAISPGNQQVHFLATYQFWIFSICFRYTVVADYPILNLQYHYEFMTKSCSF